MDMSGAGRLQPRSRSGAPGNPFARSNCDVHPSTFKSSTTDKQPARAKVQVKCGQTPAVSNSASTVPHLLINCGSQRKSEYLMEGILSTTFGKHNNFWSGNRLIITNSTDTAMNLYKEAQNHHIPSAHILKDMTDVAQTALYNALRKTEADVTNGRQPFLAIFAARTNMEQLWPILIDCIVSYDATLDDRDTCDHVQACSSIASKHHGVKAFIHLYEGKVEEIETKKRALLQQNFTLRLLSASEGRKALKPVCFAACDLSRTARQIM